MTLSEHIQDVGEADFEGQVLLRSHEVPVVVDFWAPWCGPCRILGPLLERLAIEAGGGFVLAKVNVDESPGLAIRYGVQGIPAVKAFREGKVASQFVGAQPETMVRRFINAIAPSEAEQALAEARSLLGTRHYKEAEAAFRAVFEEQDTNAEAALGLVESLLMQGKGKEGLAILRDFPLGTAWARAERLIPLAKLLSHAAVEQTDANGDPLEAGLDQAARLIARGNYAAAMDGLLEVLRQDKHYRDGFPKDVLLGIFALLGDDDPLTRKYRDELASILF